jgi:aspartyl/asparaginyl beta-hydroxylase (cupin superfamily)
MTINITTMRSTSTAVTMMMFGRCTLLLLLCVVFQLQTGQEHYNNVLVVDAFAFSAFTSSPALSFWQDNSKHKRTSRCTPILPTCIHDDRYHLFTSPMVALQAAQGFGASPKKSAKNNSKAQTKKKKAANSAQTNANVKVKGTTYNKAEQEQAIQQLAQSDIGQVLGRAVQSAPPSDDPFWDMIPMLVASKFGDQASASSSADLNMDRIAGFLRHTLDPSLPLEDDIIADPWRPHEEMHAYMPGLGPRQPFLDPAQLGLCQLMQDNYDIISEEYKALLEDMNSAEGKDRFQSVTSMNYDAGWKTLVLFYNGHRIPDFPYHLCPMTTKILETVPLAGRIAGFNRQQPQSGIPLHSDGNNMWLTCQMGIDIPGDGDQASIRVGPETRYWQTGKCLLYDTTYEHETFNKSPTQERVVIHVDFFNTLAMTPLEIDVLQYIYEIREKFLKAEGVEKVGAQIL